MFARGSIKLFDVGGTAVRIHPTFFLLLVWIAAVHWIEGGVGRAIYGVVFISILFVCVVLHEFGHILMARRFGIRTPDVTLLPIGGVASLERMPEKPMQEILVALAGPAVNLVIALVLFAFIDHSVPVGEILRLENAGSDLVAQVALANIVLLIFNLIPAFPMDGGRVLRAALTFKLGRTRATRIAAGLGQGLAIVLGTLGILGNPFLILIALFIFLAAAGEAGYVEMHDVMRAYVASDAMISRFETLGPGADADAAAALLLKTTQQEFPVVDGAGVLCGVLTRDGLVEALKSRGGRAPVLEIMTAPVPTVARDAALEGPFQTLLSGKAPIVGVVDADQRLVGYLSRENLAELLLIRNARPEAQG